MWESVKYQAEIEDVYIRLDFFVVDHCMIYHRPTYLTLVDYNYRVRQSDLQWKNVLKIDAELGELAAILLSLHPDC